MGGWVVITGVWVLGATGRSQEPTAADSPLSCLDWQGGGGEKPPPGRHWWAQRVVSCSAREACPSGSLRDKAQQAAECSLVGSAHYPSSVVPMDGRVLWKLALWKRSCANLALPQARRLQLLRHALVKKPVAGEMKRLKP